MHDARRLELAPADAVKAKIEDEHQAIFRKSVAARHSRKAALSELKETDPGAYFDITAIDRKAS